MKKTRTVIIFVLILLIAAGIAAGGSDEQTTAAKGKMLFNDPSLGTNGKTCNTCHPDGRRLEQAGTRADLAEIINGCIAGPLKGKPLAVQSNAMQSLMLYVKSLSGKKPAQKPSTGC